MTTQKPLLSNYDLIEISNKYNLGVLEVLSQEQFLNLKPKQGAYIVNINDGDIGHWTAFVIKGKNALYFDSFAVVPSVPIIKFLKRGNYKVIVNNNDIQNIDAVSCGFYCLAFLHYYKTHKNTPLDKLIQRFTALFKNDTNQNDKILQKYIRDNF